MMAFPLPGQPTSGALVAPLVTDGRRWQHLDWYRRGAPTSGPVFIRTGYASFAIPATVSVQSYRNVYEEYRQHPEAKATGPGGGGVLPPTRGLLQPASVTAQALHRIGKEANRLADTEDLADGGDDRPAVYEARRCRTCAVTLHRKQVWCADACRKRAARLGQLWNLH